MKSKPIVTFDLDGVIFPLIPYICKVHGIDPNKQTEHDIYKCNLLTKEEQQIIYDNFGKREIYEKCGVFEGAERLREVSELAEVYTNSWCVGEEEDIKREVIKKLAPNIPDDHIVFSTPYVKKNFIKSDYIVEDHLKNIMDNLNSSKHFILIDTPYNRSDVLPDKVTRVKSLNECMDLLLNALKPI